MRNEDSIGKRIANARKAAGLSQAQVAEHLDVSFQAVSSWERDQTSPDVSNIIGLAKLLNVSISSLLEEGIQYPTLLCDLRLDNEIPKQYHLDFEVPEGGEEKDG